METRVPGECPVEWCKESGYHERHQQTVVQVHGESVQLPRRTVTAQIVVYGYDEQDPRPVVVLVDSHGLWQLDSELSWDDFSVLAWRSVDVVERFR